MAPRRGQPQPEEVEEEEEEEQQQPEAGSLQFNEPLSWKAGRPIATGDLLRRLEALAEELREMDQDEVDKDSFTKVAKELASQHLLGHKDKGVRALTGCCLVDVLKLCAPDAPFSGSQLKDIFTFFITSILPALSDPSNAYNTQHKYVLASLAEVKSIVLLADVPTSESLTLHLFSSFFDIISKSSRSSTDESIAKDVEYNMSQILVTLVDESQLPTTVVDVIVAQFLRASSPRAGKGKNEVQDDKQATLLVKELPEAYNMAQTICNLCPEKMSRYISQYFNEVIVESSGVAHAPKANGKRKSDVQEDEEEDDAPTGPSEADMRELEKAHRLLRELWRASPAVLQNVIPQLEAELSADNVELRLLATQTLGDIISGIGAAGPPPPPLMDAAAYPPLSLDHGPAPPVSDSILTTPLSPQSFATTHPSVYQQFLGRKNDKSPVIRSGWTTAVGRILITSAGGIGLSPHEESTLVKGLGEKLGDADEKVRLAAVKAIGRFSFRDVMTKLATNGSVTKAGSVLNGLADRTRDRKLAVRQEGMNTLGRIWGVAAGEIAAGNESVVEALGGIPTKIFDGFYANDKELNVLLDHVLFEQLIPLNYPPSKPKRAKSGAGASQSQAPADGPFDADRIRTERILLVVKSLDAKSLKAFFAMQARQPTYFNVLSAMLKICEENNGGVAEGKAKDVKTKLDAVIKWLADLLPDPVKATLELQKYAKLHDRRSYQLLRFAMAPENDFKTVNNAIKEFTKRMKDASNVPASIMETLMPIIYRSASLIYNRSHNPVILSYSRSDEKELGQTAQKIINEISEKHPEIFKTNVKELAKSLIDQAPTSTKENDRGSVDTLRALSSFAKTHSAQIPRDRKFQQTLVNYASYGMPPRAAKYAVSILMEISEKKEMHSRDILEKSVKGWTFGKDHSLSKLAALSQMSLLDPATTDDFGDEILTITTHDILLNTSTISTDDDPSWVHDAELDEECQAKCWALKILVNRLRTVIDADTAKEYAAPIFKLLNSLIENRGELRKQNDTPAHHRTRLLLLAAQLMLKLCTIKLFDELVTVTSFNRLALVAQDLEPHVRRGFVEKLQKYIVNNKLSNRFLAIIFLTAFEPDQVFASSITTWIKSRAKNTSSKNKVFESTLPRLLHLLAHHPDYSENPLDLRDNARYILHYLSTVATEDNISLIYKYAERVKQGQDALSKSSSSENTSDRIYLYSDVAQSLIRIWIEKKGWTMQTWPTKVGLPIGLFIAMPSHEVAQAVAEKNYLPEGMDDLLEELVRNAGKKIKSKKRKADAGTLSSPTATKKVKSSTSSSNPKSSRPKKTPKPKKVRAESTPIPDSARRRSGRGATSEKKQRSYADRGDSSDDEEMLDGVAEWEYEGGRLEKDARDDDSSSNEAEAESDAEEQDVADNDHGEEEDVAEDEKSDSDVEVDAAPAITPAEEDSEHDDDDVSEPVEPSPSPPPPSRSKSKAKPNGKKIPATSKSKSTSTTTTTPSTKNETSLPTRSSRARGAAATAAAAASSSSQLSRASPNPKPKAKTPIAVPKVAADAGASASGKGKGRAATKGRGK